MFFYSIEMEQRKHQSTPFSLFNFLLGHFFSENLFFPVHQTSSVFDFLKKQSQPKNQIILFFDSLFDGLIEEDSFFQSIRQTCVYHPSKPLFDEQDLVLLEENELEEELDDLLALWERARQRSTLASLSALDSLFAASGPINPQCTPAPSASPLHDLFDVFLPGISEFPIFPSHAQFFPQPSALPAPVPGNTQSLTMAQQQELLAKNPPVNTSEWPVSPITLKHYTGNEGNFVCLPLSHGKSQIYSKEDFNALSNSKIFLNRDQQCYKDPNTNEFVPFEKKFEVTAEALQSCGMPKPAAEPEADAAQSMQLGR